MEALISRILIAAVLLVPGPCVWQVRDGDVTARLFRRGDTVFFETDQAGVRIDLAPLRLRLVDARGRVVAAQEAGGLRYERGGATHPAGAVVDFDLRDGVLSLLVSTGEGLGRVALAWRTPRALELVFEPPDPDGLALGPPTGFRDAWLLRAGERIYGLTSRVGDTLGATISTAPADDVIPREVAGLDRRGEHVGMFIYPTIALYTPFYQSSAGYGLYVERTTPGSFDVGKADPHRVEIAFEAGTLPEHRRLATHLFVGDHAELLDQYTARTGRPFRPPDWAFEHWRWRGELARGDPALLDGAWINAEVAEDLAAYDELGIPAGVYLIDRPWSPGAFGFERFDWDETRLPNPADMLDVLAARGYEVLLWSAAWARGDQPGDNGTEASALGYLAPGSDRVLDLTNPAAREWWIQKHVDFLGAWDIAGIKLDRGEEFLPSTAADVWWDGRNGREVRQDYQRLQLEVYAEAMRRVRGEDFLVVARSSWAGAQAHGIFWGGDVAGSVFFGAGPGTDLGLRSSLISLQRAAFMGLPFWGSDTGGYYEFKQRDVFARWLQFSAFCPIMEIGGAEENAPWAMPPGTAVECGRGPEYDCELAEIYRRYVQLRHDLIPYILAHVEEAVERGVPLARPLVFAYPDDPAVADRWDQYLFGADLLVAPVWRNGARERQVYLPAGAWEDFWDAATVHVGPKTLTVPAPLDHIPVFVRAGAHIPGRP